jgi:hypothetical protein
MSDAPVPPIDVMAACPPTGPCVLASGLNLPWLLVADDTNVYWTEDGSGSSAADGAVKSCPVDGCTQPRVYAQNVYGARGITIDTQNVYWTTVTSDSGLVAGGVWSCPITGCTSPRLLATGTRPYGIAVDATNANWVDESDASIHGVPKDGSGSDAYLLQPNDPNNNALLAPGQVTIDQNYLYLNDTTGNVYRESLLGGEPDVLYHANYASDWPVVNDATYVYTSEGPEDGANDAYIVRINKTTLAHTKIVPGLNFAYGVAVDTAASPSLVYWDDFDFGGGNGVVARATTAGANAANLVTTLDAPDAIALDTQYVFWADVATQSIGRIHK